jgi:hypothetical protein
MSFLPQFSCFLTRGTGITGIPPLSTIYTNEPCAYWQSRGRQYNRAAPADPPVIGQVAMAIGRLYTPPGWGGNPMVWDGRSADRFIINVPGGAVITVSPVFSGPMWVGTPDVHCRFSVTLLSSAAPPAPTLSFPTGRVDGQTTTFNIRRPFGGAVVSTGLVGVFYSDTPQGRGGYSGGSYYTWSHFLDVSSSVDIRDGMSRAAGLDSLSYADGDEVEVPSPAGNSKYVVVFVAPMRDLTGVTFHRVYLLRDQAVWPLVP